MIRLSPYKVSQIYKRKVISYIRIECLVSQKKSTRFGHFGGFVLDFPIFIYW